MDDNRTRLLIAAALHDRGTWLRNQARQRRNAGANHAELRKTLLAESRECFRLAKSYGKEGTS